MQGRINRVIRNFIYGIGCQVILMIFPFVSRTIFIKTLGADYLGINGLFSSILSVLSLAELGIGNVVIFSLYKPVAQNNYKKISALLNFYKVLYRTIGAFIFVAGVILIPFLKYLVNMPEKMDNLILYYILYLINAALSYLYVYKISIIRANQDQYVITLYNTLSNIALYIIQIIALLIWHNFALYLILQIVQSVGCNYLLSRRAEKQYPYLKEYNEKLSRSEKKEIIPSMFSMLLFKIEDVVVNSTDNLFISGMIGTKEVGYLSNYISLKSLLSKLVGIVYEAMYTSVGNLNASETYEKEKDIFDKLVYFYGAIASFVAVGFFVTSSDIVTVWLGDEFILDNVTVFAIALNFYIVIYMYPIWMYRNTTGVFNYTKKALIGSMFLNIILSFIFGRCFGLGGILLATVISRILSTFWYEPVILYKKFFIKSKVIEYFINFIRISLITCLSLVIILFIKERIESVWMRIIFEVIGCLVIQNGLYILFNKHEYIKYFANIIKERVSRKR